MIKKIKNQFVTQDTSFKYRIKFVIIIYVFNLVTLKISLSAWRSLQIRLICTCIYNVYAPNEVIKNVKVVKNVEYMKVLCLMPCKCPSIDKCLFYSQYMHCTNTERLMPQQVFQFF